jgi:hypothetical protein
LKPGVDLLHSYCALQYSQDPLDIFEKLLGLKPKVVCFSKVALTSDTNLIEIAEFSKLSSNGPGCEVGPTEDKFVRYSSRAIPQHDFEDKLSIDYKFISRIEHGTPMTHRAAGTRDVKLYSYLAILKED